MRASHDQNHQSKEVTLNPAEDWYSTAKACDSVSWEFLLQLLTWRGFGTRWTNWTAGVLATSSTRICINGESSDEIRHRYSWLLLWTPLLLCLTRHCLPARGGEGHWKIAGNFGSFHVRGWCCKWDACMHACSWAPPWDLWSSNRAQDQLVEYYSVYLGCLMIQVLLPSSRPLLYPDDHLIAVLPGLSLSRWMLPCWTAVQALQWTTPDSWRCHYYWQQMDAITMDAMEGKKRQDLQ